MLNTFLPMDAPKQAGPDSFPTINEQLFIIVIIFSNFPPYVKTNFFIF